MKLIQLKLFFKLKSIFLFNFQEYFINLLSQQKLITKRARNKQNIKYINVILHGIFNVEFFYRRLLFINKYNKHNS